MWMQFSDEDLAALKRILSGFPALGDSIKVKARVDHYENNRGDPRYLAYAQANLASGGEIEFDEDAVISEGDDPGAYVMAWVWVNAEDAGVPVPCVGCGDPGCDFDCDDADECRTEGCTNDPDNGEGYDGYCGECADDPDYDDQGNLKPGVNHGGAE